VLSHDFTGGFAMTNCKGQQELFQGVKGRKVEVNFKGGHVTSDGGVLLMSKADQLVRLTERVARFISDNRRKKSCDHGVLEMLRQRVYAICQGYEDLNDHDSLRNDMAFQTAVETVDPLASSPTLCRFENTMTREEAWRINELFIDLFIESHKYAPEELVLDFDATDDPVHGNQEGRFFHGYYDQYCFLPLYVFCEDQLLMAMLRPSNIDPARHAGAVLKLIVDKLRKAWPKVQIIVRGDSGFCRHRMMGWCERNNVGYILGIARNPRLESMTSRIMRKAEKKHRQTGDKVKLYTMVWYAAETWSRKRPVIIKAEHTSQGRNNRYIVTNLNGDSRWLYETMYCSRGEMENRIKEKQLDLFADRTSCHKWWPNQFRVLLSSMAYVLMNVIRTRALYRTELQSAQCATIRLKLLKIGAVITRNTRRICFMLSSHFPLKEIFMIAARRLNTC
jgi:hypothetical protein